MSLVNPKQYIISARSNGYKDTAYAIAELADNSIQAGATSVEIILVEGKNRIITQIGIADNGSGMSKSLLASALGFGESGRKKDEEGNLQDEDTKGMGKFGMGLPNASVSQCKRVEVWSWQQPQETNYSYLDVTEIINGQYTELPEPRQNSLPETFRNIVFNGSLPPTGTFVLWSNLDKLKWKRAKTLFEKSQFEIGRMYRRFISQGKCQVVFKVCNENGDIRSDAFHGLSDSGIIKANDPLYLTENSSLPELPGLHVDEQQTFFRELENYGKKIKYLGEEHEIKYRSSVARKEVIDRILNLANKNKVGDTVWGKDCARNFGLSIVREDRELELLTNEFFGKGDYNQERFLGVEVEIPQALDEVFGVTNTKQHAHNLKDLSESEFYEGTKQLTSIGEIKEFLIREGDEDTKVLYEVSLEIKNLIKNAKKQRLKLTLQKIRAGNDTTLDTNDKASIAIDTVFTKRDEVNPGNASSEEPNYKGIEKELTDKFGHDKQSAMTSAKKLEDLNLRISIQYKKTSNQSFFEVERLQGITVLIINPEHEVYKRFLVPMEEKDRLLFTLMLGAWARLEDETTLDAKKRQLERARNDWGEIIEDMFAELGFSEEAED